MTALTQEREKPTGPGNIQRGAGTGCCESKGEADTIGDTSGTESGGRNTLVASLLPHSKLPPVPPFAKLNWSWLAWVPGNQSFTEFSFLLFKAQQGGELISQSLNPSFLFSHHCHLYPSSFKSQDIETVLKEKKKNCPSPDCKPFSCLQTQIQMSYHMHVTLFDLDSSCCFTNSPILLASYETKVCTFSFLFSFGQLVLYKCLDFSSLYIMLFIQ